MKRLGQLCAALLFALSATAEAATHLLVLGGIGGETRYDKLFQRQVERIEQTARARIAKPGRVVALSGTAATKETIAGAFTDFIGGMRANDVAIVILIGHGAYDGEEYKFNIAGPDLSGAELADLFATIPVQRQLIVNTTSASGAVVELWRRDERIVVTATRSGTERNAARFGEYWTEAFTGTEADTDKSGELSAHELFDYATRKVADSYRGEGALATEHSRLEGQLAEAFTVLPLQAAATLGAAGTALLEQRRELEREIAQLRTRRAAMEENAYLEALQVLMLQLTNLQQRIDQETSSGTSND